jgi:hypothetical protein
MIRKIEPAPHWPRLQCRAPDHLPPPLSVTFSRSSLRHAVPLELPPIPLASSQSVTSVRPLTTGTSTGDHGPQKLA